MIKTVTCIAHKRLKECERCCHEIRFDNSRGALL